ncbi:hypothetical protein BDR26DRAFT_860563 [Obelidium mucronatum]|nr:hypothetical protein BDR26DRAFT_860563 [Obelidium mucronatum]
MVNPEGYEELRLKYPQFKEEVMKNGAPGCAGGDISTNGVNLGHNWDFEWNYPVISQEDFSDPCSPAYRGSEPFSEPETRALRDLILKHTPKSVLILHSRHTSQESRLIVPFMFHKSTFLKSESTPKNAKLKLLSDKDIDTYSLITDSMQSLVDGESKDSAYSVGTSWETIGKTISGSDLDWIFDNTGAFSLVLQIGTSKDESYWPSQKDVPKLIKKHVNPIMEFIHQSATLPIKTTSKTANSALLKHFSWIPLYLGVALFIVISSVLGTSWCLGYDKVWARFKTWAKRVERQLHNRRKQYIGLRRANGAGSSSPANRNQDVGLLPTRSSNANANAAAGSSADGGIGSSSSRVSISTDDELELMEDLVHDEDDDDEGVGFSYRA